MNKLVKDLQKEIETVFNGEEYERSCQLLIETCKEEKKGLLEEDLTCLIRYREKKLIDDIVELDKKIAFKAVNELVNSLKNKYRTVKDVSEYLDEVLQDIMDNLEILKIKNCSELNVENKRKILDKYNVNLLVDNSKTDGAPVINELKPSCNTIGGYFDYTVMHGAYTTDYMKINAGSAHRAAGGYLIIEVEEILGDSLAWDLLKKIIRHGTVKIENLPGGSDNFHATCMKPEELSVSMKVILIGNPLTFQILYENDDEFVELFKVKAAFDDEFHRSDSMIQKYLSFIANVCQEEMFLPCSRGAVAKIIDYSSRLAGHKDKLSAQLSVAIDMLREANFRAVMKNGDMILPEDISEAFEQKCYRSNTYEKKIHELIQENTILIDTAGTQIGQVNGVSILDMGDYIFGKPIRITAKTFIGSGTIVNIEREVEMSGQIHSKGVLILSGYLGQIYAQDKPLAMNASICFEQHYEEIEGDSASCAELYCLISSLSDLPLRQDIAVSGSVDQRGRVQPVGGINQKIEGFFNVCQLKGLTGTEGVIIPLSNIKNLMLNDDVVTAVKKGMFHIYPVTTIEEGLKILTNVEPGVPSVDGSFQKGTIHFIVNNKLRAYASVTAVFEKEAKGSFIELNNE
jgi:lon-related putative ATP-dependent protease